MGSTVSDTQRRLPVGAEVHADGVHFRVWAPRRSRVQVVFEGGAQGFVLDLSHEGGGYFSGSTPTASAGPLYRLRVDEKEQLLPDPASRFQPQGPFGPSKIIDPSKYAWNDRPWRGIRLPGQVLYEMHIGTFTQECTWRAAAREFPELARLGITTIELMPVADFPGEFGWGYDGVNLFAPTRLYGEPDDFRFFVDEAHRAGLGVILDVVYNHFGNIANFIREFATEYFSDKYENEWADALNFDCGNCGPVREFFLANARYWIEEFHLDGFRLDATQQVFDASADHILSAISREARTAAAPKSILIVGENEPQQVKMIRATDQGGHGMDALWNDDFHHSAMVRLTGHNPAYYSDHRGTAQEFVSLAKWSYLFQGQRYRWQKKRRGSPTFGFPASHFVNYLQNHDQIANSLRGDRVHLLTSPGRYRAMTALLLLAPQTPLIFQGQEFAASSPLLYFSDMGEAAPAVASGRAEFLSQFPAIANPQVQETLPSPSDRSSFERSKLNFAERERNAHAYNLHRDLLRIRRDDAVVREQDADRMHGAVLGSDALLLRYIGRSGDDRLLLLNFGVDLYFDPAPEPLLAPPENCGWAILWSSDDLAYGGSGTPPVQDNDERWRIPGEAAVLLAPAAT